jgi:hypothetical protein
MLSFFIINLYIFEILFSFLVYYLHGLTSEMLQLFNGSFWFTQNKGRGLFAGPSDIRNSKFGTAMHWFQKIIQRFVWIFSGMSKHEKMG